MKRDSFIFYKSFYDSIKELELIDQAKIYNAIFQYQFEDKEVKLDGYCRSIFNLIKPLLEANNKKYLNGKKGGAPKKNQEITKEEPKDNQEITKIEPKQKVMYNELCIMNNDNIKEKINKKEKYFENEELNELFLEFLQLRKKIKAVNSDRAIKMLLNKLSNYDDDTKKKMIERSILNSWKDVYEIKGSKDNKLPEWFDKDFKKDNNKINEMEEILSEFQ